MTTPSFLPIGKLSTEAMIIDAEQEQASGKIRLSLTPRDMSPGHSGPWYKNGIMQEFERFSDLLRLYRDASAGPPDHRHIIICEIPCPDPDHYGFKTHFWEALNQWADGVELPVSTPVATQSQAAGSRLRAGEYVMLDNALTTSLREALAHYVQPHRLEDAVNEVIGEISDHRQRSHNITQN